MPALTISSATVLNAAPPVVSERQITFFKFYMDQSVQEGMTYGNKLYQLAKQFMVDEQLEAYRCSNELLRQGVPSLVSVSQERYVVWKSLRSPSATSCAIS